MCGIMKLSAWKLSLIHTRIEHVLETKGFFSLVYVWGANSSRIRKYQRLGMNQCCGSGFSLYAKKYIQIYICIFVLNIIWFFSRPLWRTWRSSWERISCHSIILLIVFVLSWICPQEGRPSYMRSFQLLKENIQRLKTINATARFLV